jgi:hypothetical protein
MKIDFPINCKNLPVIYEEIGELYAGDSLGGFEMFRNKSSQFSAFT